MWQETGYKHPLPYIWITHYQPKYTILTQNNTTSEFLLVLRKLSKETGMTILAPTMRHTEPSFPLGIILTQSGWFLPHPPHLALPTAGESWLQTVCWQECWPSIFEGHPLGESEAQTHCTAVCAWLPHSLLRQKSTFINTHLKWLWVRSPLPLLES